MSHAALETLGAALAAVVASLTIVGFFSAAALKLWRAMRRVGRFLDQWLGHEETGGRRAGVIERLDTQDREIGKIRAQVLPNGGGSMRDAIDDVRRRLDAHLLEADATHKLFQEHLRGHDDSR